MRKKAGELTSFLRALDQTVGLYVYDKTLADEVSASILTGGTKLDFAGAIRITLLRGWTPQPSSALTGTLTTWISLASSLSRSEGQATSREACDKSKGRQL